ncbi:MAG TPA: LLM class flavin-dependent oxidoreductase [Methylomirabilota bacterium]|jgi:alkanesulfonate monooxygenase SsuD/methylene tetrahydromethanopterin reductase-like flavin-dependent oxidoreductase (luciferase family)|nr:LLM class flavin-dependent oxidoreductase [Methylomirabilota bacterium]
MTNVRVGLLLNTQFPPGESAGKRLEGLLDQVRAARDNGLHSVWVSQHYLATPFQMLQQLPVLGRLAAESGTMHIGTNIFLLPIHNPVYVAEQVSTLDVISGGRFVFGVGLGYRPEEFNAFDVEMKARVSRFLEVLQVARRLWTEPEVTHKGRHFQLDRAVLTLKPVQRPHPPVWIAASGDPAVERAASHGDAWLINPHASLPTLERQMALYRRALQAAGRPFPNDAPILREFRIATTRRAALDESKPYLEPKYRAYADWGLDKPMAKEERLSVPFDDLARDRFIVGTAEECRTDIERHARALGVNHFIFRVQWPGMPQEDALRQISQLGREVVRSQGAGPAR